MPRMMMKAAVWLVVGLLAVIFLGAMGLAATATLGLLGPAPAFGADPVGNPDASAMWISQGAFIAMVGLLSSALTAGVTRAQGRRDQEKNANNQSEKLGIIQAKIDTQLAHLEARVSSDRIELERRVEAKHDETLKQIKPHNLHTRADVTERRLDAFDARIAAFENSIKGEIGQVAGQISAMNENIIGRLSELAAKIHARELEHAKIETRLEGDITRAQKDIAALFERPSTRTRSGA